MAEHPKKKSGRKTFTTKGFNTFSAGSKRGEKPSRISDGTTAKKIQRPTGKQAGSIFQGRPRGASSK